MNILLIASEVYLLYVSRWIFETLIRYVAKLSKIIYVCADDACWM